MFQNIRKDIGRNLTCYGPLEVEGGGGEYRSQRNEYTWNQSVSYVLEVNATCCMHVLLHNETICDR